MRRWTFAWAWTVAAVLVASPAAAEWRQNGTTATWYARAAAGSERCATLSEVADMMADLAGESAWRGLVVAAAAEFQADTGSGECELRFVMPRTTGTAFVDAYAPRCGAEDGATLAERSAAVDRCIKQSIREDLRRYRERNRAPEPEPEIP